MCACVSLYDLLLSKTDSEHAEPGNLFCYKRGIYIINTTFSSSVQPKKISKVLTIDLHLLALSQQESLDIIMSRYTVQNNSQQGHL